MSADKINDQQRTIISIMPTLLQAHVQTDTISNFNNDNHAPGIAIDSLAERAPTVDPTDRVADLKELLSREGPLGVAVVVKHQQPVGLVMSHHLNQLLSLQYGQSLFMKKRVNRLMDTNPLVVPAPMHLETVAELAMQREEEKIYDNIIVVDGDGFFVGIVPVHAILSRMATLEKDRVEALEKGNCALEHEVREKRRAQEDLVHSKNRLRQVVENIPQAIYWKDRNLSYVGFNNNFLRDAGLQHANELIGKTDFQLPWTADEAKFVHDNDHRVLETGVADFHVIEPKVAPDGSRLFIDISRIPLHDRDDRVVGLLVTYEDITEKVLGKQEKAELELQLRKAEKMEAIGTLAGGIAHDLNNILSGVVSYPQMLLLDLTEDNPFFKPLQLIQQSGERAAAIVHDLLTMARRAVESLAPVDLKQVINDYIQSPEFTKLQTNHPNVHVSPHLPPEAVRILGAKHQLSKVIMNLISNAMEATATRGDVAVNMRLETLSQSHSGYEEIPPGAYAVIDVADSGTGIGEKDLGRIFEPFYTKKNMESSGTGLGLAVVWGIVKDHKGFIDINTQKNQGTTFSLYFPMTNRKTCCEDKEPRIEDYIGHGESILVVDDVAEQRQIASIMLQKLGYTVAAAKNGEEALALVRKNAFDILLVDMIMDPGIDGLETYQQILKIHPEQKAIIVSGYSETLRVQEALRLGAAEYIKKPYSMQNIGVAICKVLRQCENSFCN
jgi:two-component system cell cycle sensor histidine kinase/response regulator CckA